jgi:glycosyltransferase involved in cell wall biosynthesis
MRIVLDMQGAQTASRFRGIGRYTMALAQAMVRNKGEHEIFIALNAAFPDTLEPMRRAFALLLPAHQICIWHSPPPESGSPKDNATRKRIACCMRDHFFSSLEPDAIHVTSLFEGFEDEAFADIPERKNHALVAVTVYDFIPLLNPKEYLDGHPLYAAFYRQKIEQLNKADVFLAISDSSKAEAINHVALKPEQVVNISAACEDHFRPLHLSAEQAQACLEKWGIHRPYVLYTGGADERKNLPRLIQAYSELPPHTRSQHQLVFAGKLAEAERQQLRGHAATHRLDANELCFTGFITDEELVKAYNLCKLFVFPSWHEGFGLPPLEAMSCGAPVIASRTSSLPEVMGLEVALFDPFSVHDLSEKMLKALTHEPFRRQLIAHGQQQSRLFSWDQSARIALAAIENRHAERSQHNAPNAQSLPLAPARLSSHIRDLALTLQALQGSTDDDLSIVATCIAANEQQAAAAGLPRQLAWRTEGPFDSSYSLALVNREFAKALKSIGHDVALHSTEGPGDFAPKPRFLAANPDIACLHERSTTLGQDTADIVSRFTYPPRVNDMTGRINALQCYGWEESQFPAPWVDDFNTHLQCLTVMSEHVAKTMVDNGVRIPVVTVGIGIDHWERVQAEAEFKLPAKSFRFLHVSSCFPRKGADAMLKAYGQAFRAQDDVSLVIKTFANPHNEIHQWLEQARAGDASYPDVQILEGDYTDERLKALYEACHALIAPSRAEGFGLPLAEAMLSGLAVITTAWSGQLDFCNPKTAWLVDYNFAKAQTHFDLDESVWAEPDIPHLTATLREVQQATASQRQQRASRGRDLLLQQFKWTDVARRAELAIRQHAARSIWPSPRIGWVTTWNTRCGIASFAAYLVAHMPTKTVLLANHANELTAPDDPRVIRCWHANDQDPLQSLNQAVEQAQLDVVLIQFNYGFFNFQHLSNFIQNQTAAGRRVVVEMHATTDPASSSHKRLKDLVPALSQCSRILVHSITDLNRLKSLGLVNNVTLFPLGMPDYTPNPARTSDPKDFVLASYGFFLPHKGFNELIDAVIKLRQTGHRVILHMVNARYPAPQSDQAIEEAKVKIQQAKAQDFIQINTDYLEDSVSLDLLSQADLIVYPYQVTGESSSGAVRQGIASGRPVAVTPLDIFNDVKTAVYQLPGTQAQEIAQGLSDLMAHFKESQPGQHDKAIAMEKWRKSHLYATLAIRLHNMLTGLHLQAPRTRPI